MGSNFTFVDICAACCSFAHRVSQLAVTDEGSLCVLTLPAKTDVRVQLALIHIQASLHIFR